MSEKTIGIVGGMGPLATADLFRKIIQLTDARCDQDHIHVIIDNNTLIPDRTDCIINGGPDPREKLIESCITLEKAGADCLIMPCNTAHYFIDDISNKVSIPFFNMIEETAKYIHENYTDSRIGLLATEGTCSSGVYDKALSDYEIDACKPAPDFQNLVTKFIYDIKKGNEVDLGDFYNPVNSMKLEGAEVFILGCTELSVAYEQYSMEGIFIDPLEIIAKKSISFVGKKIK